MNDQQIADLLALLRDQPSTWLTVMDDHDKGYATGWNDALDAVQTYLKATNTTV